MKKVLVVDDEPMMLNILTFYLKKTYFVDTESNPQNVIERCKNNEYSAIVTDFYMPEMTGLELVQSLKKEGINVPIILMSGSHLTENEKKLFNGFLHKPFQPEDIIELIEKNS
jgi:CheY-like chemotaxis protein